MLARGRKQKHIAATLGVCEDTVTAWKKLPGFMEVVADTEREDDAHVIARIQKGFGPAADTLEALAEGAENEFAKLNAASVVYGARIKLLLAKQAALAKQRDDAATVEEQAAAVRAALAEMDERTGTLG